MWKIPNKYIAAIVVFFIIAEFAIIIGIHLGYTPIKITTKAASSSVGEVRLLIQTPPSIAISTEFSIYSPNTTVKINGSGFTANGNVSLTITNFTGSTVSGFPINLTANSTGRFNATWNISSNHTGNYTITAHDQDLGLDANKIINVSPPYIFTNAVARNSTNGTIPITFRVFLGGVLLSEQNNSLNFSFDFGRDYLIVITPIDFVVCRQARLVILNAGGVIDTLIELEEPAASVSTKIPALSDICPFELNISFVNLTLEIEHTRSLDFASFKCRNWNFSGVKCIGENWTFLNFMPNGVNRTNVTVNGSGDPSIGIGTTCGDSSCNGAESCVSCSQDCGSCPAIVTAPQPTVTFQATQHPCPYPIQSVSINLDSANIYAINFNSCDNVLLTYNGVQSPLRIRRYLSSADSLGIEVAGKYYVLKLNEPTHIDVDGDGSADITIVLKSLKFNSVFEISRIYPIGTAPAVEKVVPSAPETQPGLREAATIKQPGARGQVKAVVLLLAIIAIIGILTTYWRKLIKEEKR